MNQYPVNPGPGVPTPPQNKKNHSGLIILITILLLIGICIGGGFLYVHLLNKAMGKEPGSKVVKNEASDSMDANSASDNGSKDLTDANNNGDITDLTDYSSLNDSETEDFAYDGPEEGVCTQFAVSYDENGDFQHLKGTFDTKISSSDEALQFIASHADEIGLSDPTNMLRFESQSTFNNITTYKFQQVLQEVPVYGNRLIVAVGPDGSVNSINGSCAETDISTTPSKTMEEAEALAKSLAGENAEILTSELTILPISVASSLDQTVTGTSGSSPLLAYNIDVVGNTKAVNLLLDAGTGNVLAEYSLFDDSHETIDAEVNGKVYHVELEKEWGNYVLKDETRNLYVASAHGATEHYAKLDSIGNPLPLTAKLIETLPNGHVILDIIYSPDYPKEMDEFLENACDPLLPDLALSTLSSVQNAYDFYADRFGWKSINGKGHRMDLIVGIHERADYEKEGFLGKMTAGPDYYDNSSCSGGLYAIFVGAFNDVPFSGKGILGHEYTHGVIYHKIRLVKTLTADTINEGYSDVMGSIISDDWDFLVHEFPKDWEYYEESARSATNPNDFKNPAIMDESDPYYMPDTDDSHHNATLLSHTAYLMSEKGVPNDRIAKIFFGSMDLISHDPTFEEVGYAVIDSTKNDPDTAQYLNKVITAFTETKILKPNGTLQIKVHCGDHPIPEATVTINSIEAGKTDENGQLTIQTDPWGVELDVEANKDGFNSLKEHIFLYDKKENLDFNLAPNRSFGKVNGSDREKKGDVTGEKVTVTIWGMSLTPSGDQTKATAQEYYVRKGSKIDLNLLVKVMNIPFVKTDGTRIFLEAEDATIEFAYYIYGTDEIFDFSQPINESVVLEPKICVDGLIIGSQDINDLLKALDKDYDGTDLNDVANELDRVFNGDGLKDFADKFYDFWED